MVCKMNPIRFDVEKTGHKISYEYVPVDAVFNIPIFDENGDILGRAWLTQNLENGDNGNDLKEKIVLCDIIVYDPEDRGKGVGDELMGFLTSSGCFQQIVTGLSTKAGRALCLKWGFTVREHKHNKFLIWEAKDGKNSERQEGRDGSLQEQLPSKE